MRLSSNNHSEVSKDEIRTSLVDMHINRLNGLRDYESPDNLITEYLDEVIMETLAEKEDEEEAVITIKY